MSPSPENITVSFSWRTERCFLRPRAAAVRKLALRAAELAGTGLDSENPLGVSFLSSKKMAEVNWDFLQHKGDTDVICFDYRESRSDIPEMPCDFEDPDDGEEEKVVTELLICPAVAAREAGKRGLPYSRELILYMVHGLLHASGYDDLKPELKRKMRNAERRVLTALEKEFGLYLKH